MQDNFKLQLGLDEKSNFFVENRQCRKHLYFLINIFKRNKKLNEVYRPEKFRVFAGAKLDVSHFYSRACNYVASLLLKGNQHLTK